MRWPFRRPAPSSDAPEPVTGETPAAPAAEAWRELEPLRTIRPVELTADGRRFSRGLGVRHPVELALRPLGHNLSLDAPQGLVSNIARAVVASDRELDLPLVPTRPAEAAAAVVPRRQAGPRVVPAPVAEPVLPSPASPPAPVEATGEPARSPALEAPETPEPEPSHAIRAAPPRQLEAVERPALSRPERRSEPPLVPRPLPVAQSEARAPVTSAPVREDEAQPTQAQAPPPPSADVVEVAPAAELPTVGTRLEPTIEIATPPAPSAAALTPPPTLDAPDVPVPLVRRPGLGAPIVPGAAREVVRPLAPAVRPCRPRRASRLRSRRARRSRLANPTPSEQPGLNEHPNRSALSRARRRASRWRHPSSERASPRRTPRHPDLRRSPRRSLRCPPRRPQRRGRRRSRRSSVRPRSGRPRPRCRCSSAPCEPPATSITGPATCRSHRRRSDGRCPPRPPPRRPAR